MLIFLAGLMGLFNLYLFLYYLWWEIEVNN